MYLKACSTCSFSCCRFFDQDISQNREFINLGNKPEDSSPDQHTF